MMSRHIAAISLVLVAVEGLFGSTAIYADDANAGSHHAITMQVVNQAGEPQSNANITMFSFDRDWRYWKKVPRELQIDATGKATFEDGSDDTAFAAKIAVGDKLKGYRDFVVTDENPRQEARVTVEPQLVTRIRVHDDQGNAVAGARIWQIDHSGTNGSLRLGPRSLSEYGLEARASDVNGELELPELPPGKMSIHIVHPEFSPIQLENVEVGKKDEATAEMKSGVKLTLQLKLKSSATFPDAVMLDCRHDPFDDPSTLIGQLVTRSDTKSVQLTVAPGDYEQVRLTHPLFAITPYYVERYGHGIADQPEVIDIREGQNVLTFTLRPKVKFRGRVVNANTGEPMVGQNVEGSLNADERTGPAGRFAEEWSHIDWGETDKDGNYELSLAAGRARVSFEGQGLVADPDHFDFDVAESGTTPIPDFKVRPMPKVRGRVVDENDKPIANAVVRFRGSTLLYATMPVVTDETGRFELAPPFIPQDFQSHERLPDQKLVAFDPVRPVSGEKTIRLKAANIDNVVLKLKPEQSDLLSPTFAGDFSPWAAGVVSASERERLGKISLAGKPAPELDGADWLNTDGTPTSLAKLKGKYVLLQFWTTWCGPCHQDMPMVRLLDTLYRKQGLVVIGIHDNSMPLAAIKEDVEKQKLTYPIVVDQPDGRIVAAYKAHGISGYPSYVLIGPDGLVILDDTTVPGPSLRSFKIEIMRRLLMTKRAAG